MKTSLSIQDVINNKNNYNLAIPFVESQQINPFYKLSVSLVMVDTSDKASQIFKVGAKNLGNNKWENLYSLMKPFLQKLATEAGIQMPPNSSDVTRIDENTWKATAFGAIKLPDGTVRTSSNFKVIDLITEEQKYKLSYQRKAEKGIEDFKAAKLASESYSGQWVDTGEVNEKGYPVKVFVVSEQDREKYINASLLDAMAQLRANAPQKAATGAILRVIRDLLGIKGTYTIDELKKPFAVARMAFSPDYNDPMVKQMMLQQAMQSVGNLFGNSQPVLQTISVPSQVEDPEDEIDMPVDVNIKGEAKTSYIQEEKIIPIKVMTEEDRKQDFCCDKCGKVIAEKVWNYSVEKFERPLCYGCQKIIREQGGNN